MKSKSEVLISGIISRSEVDELNSLFTEIEIHKMETKGLTPMEFVQIIFNDFEVITFTRDFILGSVLTGTLIQIKKILSFLSKRNKKAKNVSIEIQIKAENKSFLINMVSDPDKLELMIDLTNNEMLTLVENAEDNCLVHVIWNQKGDSLEIQYL